MSAEIGTTQSQTSIFNNWTQCQVSIFPIVFLFKQYSFHSSVLPFYLFSLLFKECLPYPLVELARALVILWKMINTFVQVTSKYWNTVVSFVNKDPLFHWMSGNPLSFFFHSRFLQTQVTLVILGWQLKRFCTNQQSLETEEKLIFFYDSPPLRPTTSGKTSQ